jgi:hypothetical protein
MKKFKGWVINHKSFVGFSMKIVYFLGVLETTKINSYLIIIFFSKFSIISLFLYKKIQGIGIDNDLILEYFKN